MKTNGIPTLSGLGISDRKFSTVLLVIYAVANIGVSLCALVFSRFFYIGPPPHGRATLADWVAFIAIITVIVAYFVARRSPTPRYRFSRILLLTTVRMAFWAFCIGPLLIAGILFGYAYHASDVAIAGSYRDSGALCLVVGLWLQWPLRSVVARRVLPNTSLEPTPTAP